MLRKLNQFEILLNNYYIKNEEMLNNLDNKIKQLANKYNFLKRTTPTIGEEFIFPDDVKEIIFFTSTSNSFDFMPTYIDVNTIINMKSNEASFRLLCASLVYPSTSTTRRHLVVLSIINTSPISFRIASVEYTSGYVYAFYKQ